MKLTIELDTSKESDVALLADFSKTMHYYSAIEVEQFMRKTGSEELVADKQEQVEEPKPKRTRRTKAEIEADKAKEEPSESLTPTPLVEPAEESKEEPVAEEHGEMPFDAEVAQEPVKEELPEVKAPTLPTATEAEFRKVWDEKRKELGVYPGNEFESFHGKFVDYVHNLCESHSDCGERKPTKLTPEQRYRFLEQLKTITWNAEHDYFEPKVPF